MSTKPKGSVIPFPPPPPPMRPIDLPETYWAVKEWGIVKNGKSRLTLIAPGQGSVDHVCLMARARRIIDRFRKEEASFALWRLREHRHRPYVHHLLTMHRKGNPLYPVYVIYTCYNFSSFSCQVRGKPLWTASRPWMQNRAFCRSFIDTDEGRLALPSAVAKEVAEMLQRSTDVMFL